MFVRCAVALACCLFISPTWAQEEGQGFEPPKPVEQHKELVKQAGTWEATIQMWMDPNAEPQVSKGSETNTMVGDFWLVSDFKGELMGMPFTGRGQNGYDPVKKKYVGTWIDSMTPHLMTTEGEVDAKGDLVMIGTAIDSMTNQEMKSKMISRVNADGSRTFEMHAPVGGDEWMKVLQIDYTKKK